MSNRIIHELPPLDWAGLKAPCSDVSVDFGHRYAEREYAYVDGAAHEWTGRTPIKSTVTLLFLNTIEPDLYPSRFAKWKKAIFGGQIGTLSHPDLGVYNARPESGSYSISAEEQAGVTLKLTFIESLDEPDQPTKFEFSESDAVAAAKKVDENMVIFGIDYPDGFPEPSLEEAIAGFVGTVSSYSAEVTGKIANTIGTVDRIHDQVQLECEFARNSTAEHLDSIANSVARSPLELALDDLRWILKGTLDVAGQSGKAVKTFITPTDISLSSVSFLLGADLGSLIDLNPNLIGRPTVPKSTTIKYFAAA